MWQTFCMHAINSVNNNAYTEKTKLRKWLFVALNNVVWRSFTLQVILLNCADLKRFCVEFLSEAMNKSNCLDIQRSGQLFNIPALCDAAETMTARNFADIIEQTQFQELDKASVVKFLSSRDQKVRFKMVHAFCALLVYFQTVLPRC